MIELQDVTYGTIHVGDPVWFEMLVFCRRSVGLEEWRFATMQGCPDPVIEIVAQAAEVVLAGPWL